MFKNLSLLGGVPKARWEKWDLRNIKALCKGLGNPQESFESIHIVGTNGKGSTAFYLANILQAHGVATGLFTSPHLVSVRERLRFNGEMISQREFASLLRRVEKAAKIVGIEPSFFEFLTAASFLWFKEKKVQVAVLEAGLGGRLDCTKIAKGNIVALTSIGLDHTELLGNTKEKILKEKLGILKKGATLVLGNLPKKLISKCPPHIKAKKITPELKVGNYGRVYIKNAELAYAVAAFYLNLPLLGGVPKAGWNKKLARSVLKRSTWPGRMQMIFSGRKLRYILDGAHNPQAAKELAKCLKEKKLPPMPCIFASLTDKDTVGVLKALKPYISVCYPMQVESSRSRSVEELCNICEKLKIPHTPHPIPYTIRSAPHTPTLITGSLYLIGEAISRLKVFLPYPQCPKRNTT
jgi:dihydrofolate synthase/folylpolyglutamate synthase